MEKLNNSEATILNVISTTFDNYYKNNNAPEKKNFNGKELTNQIKQALLIEFDNPNRNIHFTNHNGGEWMFDFTAFNKKDGFNNELFIALESELSDRAESDVNALKRDFNKLLVSNAKCRVFLCFPSGGAKDIEKKIEKRRRYFQEVFENFHGLE